mmetsp:Transcript_27529/g.55422  ORF Transcript_27529/g.55422 Transcript_27529/m.55422 type:complete len:480 (-) Transcript_27529:71-1510(-)
MRGFLVGYVACLASLPVGADQTDPALILSQGFVRNGDPEGDFLIPVDDDYYDYQRNFVKSRMAFDHNKVRVPLEITLQFQTNGFHINQTDEIYFRMPRMTSGDGSGASGPSFEIHQHSWATLFQVFWQEHEHTKSQTQPFPLSNLTLRVRAGRIVEPTRAYEVIISRTNGIRAQCSFVENEEAFLMGTNASKAPESQILRPMDQVPGIGPACRSLLNCNGHGFCDACRQRCECFDGFGAALNNGSVLPPRDVTIDCSRRTCQVGPVIRAIPKSRREAHSTLAECSENGICDRNLGNCKCSPGWGGTACDRLLCPDSCSGHGHCFSMEDLARTEDALPLSWPNRALPPAYGTAAQRPYGAWDYQTMHGCVCDSSWSVGLKAGQTQEAEYFGGNCGYRHCPTGDDPRTTSVDETNCTKVAAPGGKGVGEVGNKCHVDCSNRGECDFGTGQCECFEGFYGANCGLMSVRAKQKDEEGSAGEL